MEFENSSQNETSVLKIRGRLDAASVPAFKQQCLNLLSSSNCLVLDCTQLTFLDSSGPRSLVAVLRTFNKQDANIRLAGILPEVRSIFELTRLNKVFDMFNSVEDALAGN